MSNMKRRTGTHKRAPVLYGAKRFDHGGSPPAVHQSNRQSPAAIDIILHGRGKKQPQNLLYDRSGLAAADNAKGFVADFLSPVDVALGLRNVAGGELRKDLFVDIVGFLRHLRIGGLPAADIWYVPLSALLTNINAIHLFMHNTCILPHPISPPQKTEYLYSIPHFAPVVNSIDEQITGIIFCKFCKNPRHFQAFLQETPFCGGTCAADRQRESRRRKYVYLYTFAA